jgi:hypothetical protein
MELVSHCNGQFDRKHPLLAVHARSSGLKWRLMTRLLGTGRVERIPAAASGNATVASLVAKTPISVCYFVRSVPDAWLPKIISPRDQAAATGGAMGGDLRAAEKLALLRSTSIYPAYCTW